MGLFGSGATLGPPTGQLAPSNYLPTVPRPGFFDQGGLGSKLARGANAFATNWLAMDGNQGAEDQLQQQRALQNAAILRAQSLQDQRDNFVFQHQWTLDHPAPIHNDTVDDYNFRSSTLGKPAADEWLKNASDPIVTLSLPGDRVYSGPRSGLGAALGGGAAAQAPTQAGPKSAPQRPPNMTDEQLITEARKAVEGGAKQEDVFRQLQAWGVR